VTMEPSEFAYHTNCEACGSSDALAVYTDGHTHCFRCGAHSQPTDSPEYVPSMSPRSNGSRLAVTGEPVRLSGRKISQETCRKFLCYRDHTGEPLRFYYKDRGGSIVAAKLKTKDKDFSWEGRNVDSQLFGQHLWQNGGTGLNWKKQLIITEGEIDAMTVAEAMPKMAVVSIPNGAPAAKKAIQAQLEWLQGWEEVVLFFDNDEAGTTAAQEAASVLPHGRVRIARLGTYKDASDAWVDGRGDLIRSAIYDAERYVPGGIVRGQELLSAITTPTPPCAHDYPYGGLQEKLHGIRYGELVTVTAGSGIGKSSICRELATQLLVAGERVGYLALEESNRRTALGLMSSYTGKAYHLGEHTAEELKEAYDQTLANWQLYLFDGFGSYDPDVIYNRVEYMALGLGVRVVFLDHLSILLSGLDGDERRMIDQTMTRLRSLVERTGIALFLVCHLSGSGDGGSYEEGGRVKLTNLRGSKSIGQLSDAVIALERDQQEDTDTTVRVLKNRLTGEVGIACHLEYDLETCRYKEVTIQEVFSSNPLDQQPPLEDF
jgi:twinkle protein